MNISPSSEFDRDVRVKDSLRKLPDSQQHAVLTGLLGVAERVMELTGYLLIPAPSDSPSELDLSALSEPSVPGLYRDRDGDIWERTADGWRLRVQQGVQVNDACPWNWIDGHVHEYGPFSFMSSY
ncbi:hypothetical protein AB0L82_36945 [Nocardia sp. NPDC052001]|uniref:hypothetical protein n=1 Tax=Nocardia sp. NPDC052001 TaxID=3154853 RepID=UPI0034313576